MRFFLSTIAAAAGVSVTLRLYFPQPAPPGECKDDEATFKTECALHPVFTTVCKDKGMTCKDAAKHGQCGLHDGHLERICCESCREAKAAGVEPGHEIDPCQADCPYLCYKSCHDKCDKGNIGTKDCEDCAKGKALRKAG